MRKLSNLELQKLEYFTSKSVEIALIETTETVLRKSIMDATAAVRDFFERENIHHYDKQNKGPEFKVSIPTQIITPDLLINSTTSLYRPVTKNGDPRIWVYGMKNLFSPNDILAIAYFDSKLWVFNLTTLPITSTPIVQFTQRFSAAENIIAKELLGKIKEIAARGYIPSRFTGDTAIGRLLETELGIPINSSKNPDYKGIELKSARSKRNTRKGLFAQVPDWDISRLQSSREVLYEYGYFDKEHIRRLECTVKAKVFNPQTLSLEVDDTNGFLNEVSNKSPKDVVSWRMNKLETRLQEKHAETFWVEADVKYQAGTEWFKFTRITHTKNPIISQMSVLLSEGKITVDHMIKETGTSVVEKGPAFKLEHKSLPLLFPPSELYVLEDR